MEEQYWAVLTELNELKADLRKLVADLRIGGKSLSPDATHAYMFCADKIEKLLNGGRRDAQQIILRGGESK